MSGISDLLCPDTLLHITNTQLRKVNYMSNEEATTIDEMVEDIRGILRSYETSTDKIEKIQNYLEQVENEIQSGCFGVEIGG